MNSVPYNNDKNFTAEIIELTKGHIICEEFEILNYIKSGEASHIYKGKIKKSKTEKLSALKFFIQKNNNDQNEAKYLKEVYKEIILHYKLKHKNILQIYGCYTINGGTCLSMEYCNYGDLNNFIKNILKKPCLSETIICFISSKILDAIFHLHKNKIIHFDINPQNILVDDYLNFFLADFSVSLSYKSMDKYIKLNTVGTSYYICPESLNEKRIKVEDASKVDIYSFGVLLYYLAFEDYPYNLGKVKDKEYSQMAKNIQENELQFPKNINHSKMFLNFISKCLDKDINKRYNIYDALRDPWVKANKYILDEQEKLGNASKFLIIMVTNFIDEFNKYVKL